MTPQVDTNKLTSLIYHIYIEYLLFGPPCMYYDVIVVLMF